MTKSRYLIATLLFGIVLAFVWMGRTGWRTIEIGSTELSPSRGPGLGEISRSDAVAALVNREKQAAETIWAQEMVAQECGRSIEYWWDALNAVGVSERLGLLARAPLGELVLGKWTSSRPYAMEIDAWEPSGPGLILGGGEWPAWLESWVRQGWQLEQAEFRQSRFEVNPAGGPGRSTFYATGHLVHPGRSERVQIEGDLVVEWGVRGPGDALVPIRRVDASRLAWRSRRGPPVFASIFDETMESAEKDGAMDPLIVRDLDGDGWSEIILVGRNAVYRRRADGGYAREELCRHPAGGVSAAVLADLTGDGYADLLGAKPQGLFLFAGSASGTFDQPGRLVWVADPLLRNPMVLTCGDVDHDGDVDVFLGQYKLPTLGQIFRPNYYDANDSYPAHLLLNRGGGELMDVTEVAGLGPKRGRRIFSASLVDLNGDRHLDLVLVSDFAGLDLFENDGRGRFQDRTSDWVTERHAFGMGHVLADFNVDGRLDLLMIGMTVPTVDRLEAMGVWRSGADPSPRTRARMASGNRLYFGRADGGFAEGLWGRGATRTGWSWGASALDVDNDGYLDLYVANGHESKQSVRDYEPEFWLHDLFVDGTVDDATASRYLLDKYTRTRGSGWSYAGYEKNRLYLNARATAFLEVGYLLGVAFEQDSRNVVSDDLDGDGRVDLMVTTEEVWPKKQRTLRVLRNTLAQPGNWIGFRFGGGKEALAASPFGASVTLIRREGGAIRRDMVAGDSFRSQHGLVAHFGLDGEKEVDRVEIQWSNGARLTLRQPPVNRYHSVEPPNENER